jgi:hypothetical protein
VNLPPLCDWKEIHRRLAGIFPPGTPAREHATWEIAAKTIFVMLYVGAIEGSGRWLRPDQVTRMTDRQAARVDETARLRWTKESMRSDRRQIPRRWYAVNTRESIRDDTIRYSLIPTGSVIERPGLTTTSPAGRYALHSGFAALFDPTLTDSAFEAEAAAWRDEHLNAGQLARIAVLRNRAVAGGEHVLVTFPNGETRAMSPGTSTDIAKAVIEVFAPRLLAKPGVIFLSESGNKVVARDDKLAKAIGLNIVSEKNLPDIVLADLGPKHPLLVFVEVVATDGPINEPRKQALLAIAAGARFPSEHTAFVTAYLDRSAPSFRRTVASLAWGSYAWFAAEPERLVVLTEKPGHIGAT